MPDDSNDIQVDVLLTLNNDVGGNDMSAQQNGFVVSKKEKFAYGIGDFAINIAYTTLGFYIVFFMVNVAGLPAEWAGLVFLIARAWDAITDYIMGTISDRTKSRWGRRRPFILFGCIPFGLTFILLWVSPFKDTVHIFVYYIIIVMLFNTAFTVVSIPYNSLLPDLSQNYNERTSISGVRMGFTFVGNLIAAAGVAVIVDVLFPGKSAYRESYPVMGVIFASIMIVSLLITFFGTKERVSSQQDFSDGLLKSLKSIMRLKEFRIMVGMFLFNMIGFDLILALFIFFLKDVIKAPENLTFVLMGIPLLVAVAAVPFWVFIGEKMGKNKTYIIAAIYFALAMLTCLILPEGNIPFVIILTVLAGIGISASQVIPFSMLPDFIEFDEYKNGVRREGAFYGIIMFFYKVASAIAIGLATGLLGYFGYVENSTSPQPQSAIMAIRVLMGIGSGICFLISAYFVKILPITRESFEEVKRALEERKKGETTDVP